jgi:hypothetical protein
MTSSSQKRAVKAYRERLSDRGLIRFEVRAPDADRTLIQSLARQLSEHGADAARLRAALKQTVMGEPPRTGDIVAALRRSPLVGADLELERPTIAGRAVDL